MPKKGFNWKITVGVRIHLVLPWVFPHDWNLAVLALSHLGMSNPILLLWLIFWPYLCLLTSLCFCLTQQGPGKTHISLHQTVFTLPGSGLFYPQPMSVHCGILYYLPSLAWCWWAHMLKNKRPQLPHWGSGKDSLFWSLRNWGRWVRQLTHTYLEHN